MIPDWGALIGLIPLALLVLLLGPILSLMALGWLIYMVRKPRAKLAIVEGPYAAPLDQAGQPVYPTGQPYCAPRRADLPERATICANCREELVVTCPKCGIGRQARVRDVRELRADPPDRQEGRAAGRSSRRGRRRVAPRPPDGERGPAPVLDRGHRRGPGLRRPRRPCRPAGQRPAGVAAGRGPPRAGLRRRRQRLVRRSDGERGHDDRRRRVASRPAPVAQRARPRPPRRGPARPVARRPRRRGRSRTVGQHVRVHGCLRVHDPRRLPRARAALPDPLDRVRAVRGRPRAAALREQPAERRQAARPGAPERAAPDDPRRHGHDRLRDLRDELRGGRRLPGPGHRPTGSAGCRRTRSSTRSPIGRSSSASRSSRR